MNLDVQFLHTIRSIKINNQKNGNNNNNNINNPQPVV